MVDDNKHDENDEEYHFSEGHEPETYAVKQPRPQLGEKVGRRGLFIAISVIGLAFFLYKLLGMFWGSTPAKSKITTTTTVVSKQPPVISTPAPAAPVAAPVRDPYKQEIGAMQANEAQYSQQLSTLTENVANLSNTVTKMQESANNIQQQLQTIVAHQEQQQAQLNEIIAVRIKAEETRRARVVVRRPSRPRLVFQVQAIVPGRAWLVMPDGNTITVRVGDRLPDYGKVTEISPIQGTVVTSSGAIIRL